MADQRPNVILFTTDQHRGDCLSIAGHPHVETPFVDSFASSGAYFPNAYTEISSTTGARRCLLAGQASHACGLIGYSSAEWHERNTLAQVLADAGYHCINVGWRNLHPRRKLYGFHTVVPHDLREPEDEYLTWLRRELGPGEGERSHGVGCNDWTARPWSLDSRYHPSAWTTGEAIEQLKRRDPTRPFFLWVSYLRPHSPYDPPRDCWDLYAGRELDRPAVGQWVEPREVETGLDTLAWQGRLSDRRLHAMRAGYYGNVTHLDFQARRLAEWLEHETHVTNNMWVFCSDHGDMLGDHHLLRKCQPFEGSARICMAVRYPRGLDLPTGRFEQPVGLQDVMPTILDAVGVSVPDSVTGQSLLDAVRGQPWREFMHGEHSPCYSLEQANQYLTDGREKYIWWPTRGVEQFFDLTVDRQELHDLAGAPEHADRVALWRQRLIDLLTKRGDGFADDKKLLVRKERYGPMAE